MTRDARTPSLRGTCAVVVQVDGGDDFGVDPVTPVAYTLGVVVSLSRDGRGIRAVEDIHGDRRQATRHTYRLPSLYPCAMRAALRATPPPGVGTVEEIRRLVCDMIHRPEYRAAVIAHDLDRACECGPRRWRR